MGRLLHEGLVIASSSANDQKTKEAEGVAAADNKASRALRVKLASFGHDLAMEAKRK